jgi:ribulose-phosphate 3-epimerase
LNPATPLTALEEVLPDMDYVLLMSVNPGFGGQRFIMSALDKLRRLRALLRLHGSQAQIEIDGGITADNAAAVADAGAEILVAGSAVFGQADPAQAVQQLLQVVTEAQLV